MDGGSSVQHQHQQARRLPVLSEVTASLGLPDLPCPIQSGPLAHSVLVHLLYHLRGLWASSRHTYVEVVRWGTMPSNVKDQTELAVGTSEDGETLLHCFFLYERNIVTSKRPETSSCEESATQVDITLAMLVNLGTRRCNARNWPRFRVVFELL